MRVDLRKWPDAPPSAHESHEITQLIVSEGNDGDPNDPRFALTFITSSGRRLCVRLPWSECESLANCLFQISQERSWQ
jgi:hypothetical protein